MINVTQTSVNKHDYWLAFTLLCQTTRSRSQDWSGIEEHREWHFLLSECNEIVNMYCFKRKSLSIPTPANGYVPEGKRTKVCKIWLSGDKIYLLCRSKLSRSACGAWKLSNDRTSTGHVTGKTHVNRMCTG